MSCVPADRPFLGNTEGRRVAPQDESGPIWPRAPGRPGEPPEIVLVVDGPIDRRRIPHLCRRLRMLLREGDAELIVCDVGDLGRPSAVTVDALARMQLTARRLGRRVTLRHACRELEDLLTLTGLREVIPTEPDSRLEPGREAEEREQDRGVEEEGDSPEPVA